MIKALISDEIAASLYEQIGHEKYNANLYLFIAGFLKNKGLENLAKHFEGQHDEETNHAKMIYCLLTDLSIDVKIPEISAVDVVFDSIVDVANVYLEREIITTESLDEIKRLAIEERNPVVEEAMREMIGLQKHEYAEATDFLDKAQLTGNDWKFVLMWDIGLK